MKFELLSPGKYLPANYWSEVAPATSRVEVELGPGDGRFLIEAAKRDSATLYVGVELRSSLARQLRESRELADNMRVYNFDGRWVITYLLAGASIDAFHLYFPDPWWKKRHHKRRLFTDDLCANLHRCLKAGGKVYAITDVEGLSVTMREMLGDAGLTETPWRRTAEDAAQSSYERKYRRQGRHLFESCYVKRG